MPWQRQAEDIEAAQDFIQALRDRPNHSIADDAYVAPGADIHTESLAIGSQSWIAAHTLIRGNLSMGEHCSINPRVSIAGKVRMGDGVRIASFTTIIGFDHGIEDTSTPIFQQPCIQKGIHIGDDVWIGANVVICDGVQIGSHSVIAAGAIVVKDVPDYSLVGGNPARVIRDRRKPRRPSVEAALAESGERANDQWKNILRHCEAEIDGERIYLDPQKGQASVRAWCDAIEIARFFNEVPPLESAEGLIERLQSYQEPRYGLILSPGNQPPERKKLVHLPEGYHFLAVGYALECLGSHIRDEIKAISELSLGEVYAHLDTLNWTEHGWSCGDWVDIYTTGLYHNLRYHETTTRPEPIFGWLNTHCNPSTGMWSPPLQTDGWLQAVNGFYRLTRGSYAQFGHPLPYPESSIDTLLSHCRYYGNFLEKDITACNVLDIVHPLWLCSRQSDHRRDEIRAIMETQVLAIHKRWEKNRGFAFCPGAMKPGLQGTEMWLSILAIAADYLGLGKALGFQPQGVHRLAPWPPAKRGR